MQEYLNDCMEREREKRGRRLSGTSLQKNLQPEASKPSVAQGANDERSQSGKTQPSQTCVHVCCIDEQPQHR